ncbi:MAG: hypothetical protein AAFZ18_14885 [Myxococcota bacterium]
MEADGAEHQNATVHESARLPPRKPTTPFAALRVVPPGPPQKPTRFPALRTVLKAGTIIGLFTVTSAGGCGLVAGGMHGLAFATVLFSAMAATSMLIATGIAAAFDGHRAARLRWEGEPVLTTCVPQPGAGQLSVTTRGGALSEAEKPSEPPRPRRLPRVFPRLGNDVSVVVLRRSKMHNVRAWRRPGHLPGDANLDG